MFDNGLTFVVRAYDDAVAYRWETNLDGHMRIDNEEVRLAFPGDPVLYAPLSDCTKAAQRGGADCFHTSFEEIYTVGPLGSFARDRQAFLPVLVDEGAGRAKVLVTEADLDDYPGLWFRVNDGGNGLTGIFPRVPLEEGRRRRVPTIRRDAPWELHRRNHRAPIPAVACLRGRRPGRSPAGHGRGATGSEGTRRPATGRGYAAARISRSGCGTTSSTTSPSARASTRIPTATISNSRRATVLRYLFFDAGWSKPTTPLTVTPGLDVPGLVREARAKGLGVVLWTLALAVDHQMDAVMDQFQAWGVTGMMVDFMDRDDQPMVNFYRRVLEAAAKRHLMVDFHGAYKPTGLERRFPNAVTREGDDGVQYDKWSDVATPEDEVTLPFIRGVAGPIDYEPGHMRNAQKDVFKPMGALPMTQGTRMHRPPCISSTTVPTPRWAATSRTTCANRHSRPCSRAFRPFGTTRAFSMDASPTTSSPCGGRPTGRTWVGAMTDWTPRDLQVPLAFLPAGAFTGEIWQDGPNAARYGSDWQHVSQPVSASHSLAIHMAPGGGYVARIVPQSSPAH